LDTDFAHRCDLLTLSSACLQIIFNVEVHYNLFMIKIYIHILLWSSVSNFQHIALILLMEVGKYTFLACLNVDFMFTVHDELLMCRLEFCERAVLVSLS